MKTLLYEDELVERFRGELRQAKQFSFGMALVRQSGLDDLLPSILQSLHRGAKGRILFGIDLPSDPNAIASLCRVRDQFPEDFEVRLFQPGARRFFHPKLSVFAGKNDRKTAIVGSSNLTHGGLVENYEANVFIDNPKIVQQLEDYFEEHFYGGHGKEVDTAWLSAYRRVWAKREKAMDALRRTRVQVRAPRRETQDGAKPLPARIKGHVFAFTGRIVEWPRKKKLYPVVKSLGGRIASDARRVHRANCLIHGEILDGRESTLKLRAAHKEGIPVITEDEFFGILKSEQRRRKRR
jgi:HKD family nuclease